MASLSPQDDFARWARVRRKHDKLEASLESVSSQVSSQRTGFDRTCSGTRWMLTKGLWWGILTWGAFRGWVVFWVPGEWALPWFVLWLLKFPRAPYGAVGVQVWGMAVGAACEVLVGGSTMVLELRKATAMKEGGRAPLAGQDPAAAEAIKKAA